MEIFLVWVGLSVVAGIIASNKGRSGFGFFLLSVALSPLIGILAAVAASKKGPGGGERKCPFCAEFVKQEAKVCKHCGHELPSATAAGEGAP